MMLFWHILFWASLLGMLSSYLLYPAFMLLISKSRQQRLPLYSEPLPDIEMIFAAHNEAAVLEAKLHSVLSSEYPPEKLTITVGSDCSTDATNDILAQMAKKFPQRVRPVIFQKRQGKSAILNKLAKQSKARFLLLTDANIMFQPNTVNELLAGIKDEQTGACGGVIKYNSVGKKGIARQESDYLNFENALKLAESKTWGLAMGLEGGCYLIRRNLFPVIPPLFFMEDFFVSLHVLKKGFKIYWNPRATVSEDVSVRAREEYHRKVRISIGNFQNLGYYGKLLWQQFWPVGFSFLMHKVLRWLTPFFIIFLFTSTVFLGPTYLFYQALAILFSAGILLGILGIVISPKYRGGVLKYIGHFFYMNLALFIGFFKYIKGVQSNAWQPTARNQK